MWVEASAPSNIALIKYMGKSDPAENRPCNSSLSYTLEHLRTYVRISENSNLADDQWQVFERKDLIPLKLSETGKTKFLKHFKMLKKEFGLTTNFEIQSANNFPSDCGLASSASSFAALTKAVNLWVEKTNKNAVKNDQALALLSKRGSGSSCRSFFSPWAIWSESGVQGIQITQRNFKHQVVLCDESKKLVSSSEAHRHVLTSELFLGRPERAEKRLKKLITALDENQWSEAFEICWNEFWDMHLLFHTSVPAFMYMNGESQTVLQKILKHWQTHNDGPIVTMDAGSNIHLLYRSDQTLLYQQMIELFNPSYAMWTDEGYLGKS